MPLNEGDMYTGNDGIVEEEPKGMFDNEIEDEDLKKQKEDQASLIIKMMPNAEKFMDTLKEEIDRVSKISDLGDVSLLPAEEVKVLVLAKIAYKNLLEGQYTQVKLSFEEAKKIKGK